MKKILLTIVSALIGGITGALITDQKAKKQIREKDKRIDKFYDYFQLTNQWLMLKNQGKNLSGFFEKQGYNNIAVYGIGELGSRLYEELRNSGITVKYVIDKKVEQAYPELTVYELDDELPQVDVIVVTPLFAYDEIEEQLMDRVDYPIISLEEVVNEC